MEKQEISLDKLDTAVASSTVEVIAFFWEMAISD